MGCSCIRTRRLDAEIDSNAGLLKGALERAAELPHETPVLCAGVKHVARCARGPLRLEAAVCLSHLCAADMDAVVSRSMTAVQLRHTVCVYTCMVAAL